ncbi:hypothetical protein FRB94_009847 [Tulasnella sp. JGI-2019a]|nr:hypothetical protein FRB93_013767 [Tulasnella sp. JGI-2019a]KAG9010766.1 hypothetical protein FRB94_009847 [Tulasnella sp. JGI-2019a]KAG9023256.1 hypothetical protein FRB95_013340 [Tulasnella sp. JGI-2019a]
MNAILELIDVPFSPASSPNLPPCDDSDLGDTSTVIFMRLFLPFCLAKTIRSFVPRPGADRDLRRWTKFWVIAAIATAFESIRPPAFISWAIKSCLIMRLASYEFSGVEDMFTDGITRDSMKRLWSLVRSECGEVWDAFEGAPMFVHTTQTKPATARTMSLPKDGGDSSPFVATIIEPSPDMKTAFSLTVEEVDEAGTIQPGASHISDQPRNVQEDKVLGQNEGWVNIEATHTAPFITDGVEGLVGH